MTNIRPATTEDLETLAGIYTIAYNSLNIGENWNDEASLQEMEHFYKLQPDLFFTAEEDGKIVGAIVSILKPWWDGFHLTDGEFFIDPSFQGKGIGTELIKHMFTFAQEKYRAVSWDTFTHRIHPFPLNWYKKLGFEEIKQWVMITGNIEKVLERTK